MARERARGVLRNASRITGHLARGVFFLAVVASVSLVAAPAFAVDEATCVAASEASITLRKEGHLRRALEQLAVCSDGTCPEEVRASCTRRLGDVRAALPTLVLSVKDTAGNDLVDVKVTLDGALAAGAVDGRPLPIDPGVHRFVFESPGRPSVEKDLLIREAEKDRRETVVMASTAVSPAALAASTGETTGTPGEGGHRPWSTNKTVALVSAGLGVVGVGLGAGWGVAAISSKNSEQSACASAGCAGHAQAVSDYDSAHRSGTASTVSFIAGGALVAAGVVLWFTAPRRPPEGTPPAAFAWQDLRLVPLVTATGGGLALGGRL